MRRLHSLLFAVLLSATPALASAPPLDVGDVSSQVERRWNVEAAMRDALTEELDRIDARKLPRGERYVVSARLVRMETTNLAGTIHTRATVSATLEQGRGGALVAVVRGRSSVEVPRRLLDQGERRAIRGAMRGAMRRIPDALAR